MTVIFFCSCNNNSQNKIQRQREKVKSLWMNRELIFPEKLDTINANRNFYIEHDNKPIKLVNLVNGNCSGCINSLIKWEQISRNQLRFNHLEIIHIAYSDFTDFLKSKIEKELQLSFMVLHDKNDAFRSKNNFYHGMFNSFLINNENKIICIADPFNEKELKLLLQEIRKHEPE